MGIRYAFAAGLVAAAMAFPAVAADATGLPAKKQTKAGLYLTATEAAGMLQDDGVLFLDVRSRAEVSFIGMPSRVNVHIPLMVMPQPVRYDPESQGYPMEPNVNFEFDFLDYAEAMELSEDTPIVVICRSGTRSARAADMLYDLGYTQVYSVIDGFEGDKAAEGPERGHRVVNGWKNTGLDWAYAVAPGQSYPGDRM